MFKQQIGVATETYFTPGKFTRAIDQGVPLLNDEFNNMPLNMRMAYKLYYGFKAGRDEVVLQEDSGKAHPIRQGYAFVATANLKDDRHKERFKLDPAELRELDSLHIGYIPPEELYDLCLAKLMNKDGNADITKEEALIVLKNLCDAAKEIQTGYEREKGSHFKETNFTKQSIEEAVLDPNSVLKMLDGFNRMKSGDLKTHLEKGLLDFLAKGFPPADKRIVASWFVAKGFFRDKTAQDFGIKGLDDATLNALKGSKTGEEIEPNPNQKQSLSLREIAFLDPYDIRKTRHLEGAKDFFAHPPKPEGGKGRLKEMPKIIETEFTFPDGRKEKIVLDFEAKLKEWVDLYKEKAVVLPADFEQIARALWNSNYEAIKEQTEKLGYDSFLIIPGNLNLPDFHQKMSAGFNRTFEDDNFKEGGSFAGVKSPQDGKTRIVLFHEKEAENLGDHPLIKEMLNKKLTDITGLTEQEFETATQNSQLIQGKIKVNNQEMIFDGMSVPDYLAIQSYYFKKTGKYLDSATYACLFGSFSGRRVPCLRWDPDWGELYASAYEPGNRNDFLAPRPAVVFSEFELQSSILNSEFSSDISAEFENPANGKKEKIAVNPEKEFQNWTAFYEKHKIPVPDDFREQVEDIVGRNRPEMKKAVEQMGYDKIIIVPPNLSLAELHQKMSVGFNLTYESDDFKVEGGFSGVKTSNSDRTRIILVHERGAQNVRDNSIMKETLNKTLATVSQMAEDGVQKLIDKGEPIPFNVKVGGKDFAFNGIDVLGYLIFQRDYFERTGKHLDEWGWSWLTGSSVGRRVPCLGWNPGRGRLRASADGPGYQYGYLAPRPAAVFI